MPFQRGAPRGNRNRYRHGLYSKALMERKAAIRKRREVARLMLQRVNILVRLQDALERKRARTLAARPLRYTRPMGSPIRRRGRPHRAAAIRNSWKPPRVLGFTICIDPKTLPPPEEEPEDVEALGHEGLDLWLDCLGELSAFSTAIEDGWRIDDVMKAVRQITAEERQARRWHTGKPFIPDDMQRYGRLYWAKRLNDYLEENAQLNEKPESAALSSCLPIVTPE